jgi:hypothetical protein
MTPTPTIKSKSNFEAFEAIKRHSKFNEETVRFNILIKFWCDDTDQVYVINISIVHFVLRMYLKMAVLFKNYNILCRRCTIFMKFNY